MKTSYMLAAGGLLLGSLLTANAWHQTGFVFCDANGNNQIDTKDIGIQGVLVVVTNLSGTYSNAAWTGNDGSYTVQLSDFSDSYRTYIRGDTLPAGTTAVTPAVASFSTTDAIRIVTQNFLISNPLCGAPAKCWMTGGGTIDDSTGQPVYSYGGVVNPGCSAIAAGGGNWNVVWHPAALHFKGISIEVLNCGNLPGYTTGSSSPKTPYNYIDFQGVGTLTGIENNHADFGAVFFAGRGVDLKDGGKNNDLLYLKVWDASGNVLLLISADPTHPDNVAPAIVSTGNLQLHISSCSK